MQFPGEKIRLYQLERVFQYLCRRASSGFYKQNSHLLNIETHRLFFRVGHLYFMQSFCHVLKWSKPFITTTNTSSKLYILSTNLKRKL